MLTQLKAITLPYKVHKIETKPSNLWVTEMVDVCRNNALSFNDYYDYGYLRLTCDEATYKTITGEDEDFLAPTKPSRAAIDDADSAVKIARADTEYQHAFQRYQQYRDVDNAIKQQLLEAVPDAYICDLKDPMLGWHPVSALTLIQHLETRYGKITAEDLAANEQRIQTPWHPTKATIEQFFQQHEQGLHFTKHCTKGKIDEDRLIIYATANLRQTNLAPFKDALTQFEASPTEDQTWTNFKKLITQVYNNLPTQDKNIVTTGNLNYNSANHMEDKENKTNKKFPHYCWSHGVTWNSLHTSKTCHKHRRSPNHVEEATFYDMRGGCNRIMRPFGERAVWKPQPRPQASADSSSQE